MLCVFRLDDICPTMNWSKFEKIKAVFDKHNIKPLLGIVPDNLDNKLVKNKENPFFWEYIKQLQSDGWGIAQHGYQHVYETKDGGILQLNKNSEFAGLPFHVQKTKIQKGKQILENKGIYTNIFMAPSHSYDENTLRALEEVGFAFVTDGYTRYPYQYSKIQFIPCMHVINLNRRLNGLVTICIHSNVIPPGAEILEAFILKYKDHVCSYMEFIQNIAHSKKSKFWRIEQFLNLRVLKFGRFTKNIIEMVVKAID